jgi:hypothetical protein
LRRGLGVFAAGFGDYLAQDTQRAFDAFCVYIAVCDEAHGIRSGVERPDALRPLSVAELNGVEAGLLTVRK